MSDRAGFVFTVDQAPEPFKGQAKVELWRSLDFEGWRASIVVGDRMYFNLSDANREQALLGLVELLASSL